jgi:hypothetical protein
LVSLKREALLNVKFQSKKVIPRGNLYLRITEIVLVGYKRTFQIEEEAALLLKLGVLGMLV